MPESGTAAAVLIDGPAAGRLIYVDPAVRAWNMVKPTEPLDVAAHFDLSQLWASTTLEFVTYRVEQYGVCTPSTTEVLGRAYFHLRVGWSEGAEPGEEALRRHGRRILVEHPELMPAGAILWPADPADDEPIRILDHGNGPIPQCQDMFEMHPRTRLMRGTCPCGWRTEDVESRRHEELRALTMLHGQAGMAALDALIRPGVFTPADYLELMGITDQANRRTGDSADALRYALASLSPAGRREPEPAAALYWGDPLEDRDADWPEQGSTCAHLCGDADHTCSVKATTHLVYDLPSGGKRRMPICGPCNEEETAAKERADA